MISGFGPSSTDVDTQIRAYFIAADGAREDAIRSACKRFIRGEVPGHKANRLPTSAEFAQECRSEHSAISARENRRTALPKPDNEFVASPEHRQRMRGLFGLLKRARAGDPEAQKQMRKHGWRDDLNEAAE
jgi:hypothetical protein